MPKVPAVEPFRVLYGCFPYEGEDGTEKLSDTATAFLPLAPKEGAEGEWLLAFPEMDADEPGELAEVKSHRGNKESVTFGVSKLSGEGAVKWTKGVRAGAIMFEFASVAKDYLPQHRLVRACQKLSPELLAGTEFETAQGPPSSSGQSEPAEPAEPEGPASGRASSSGSSQDSKDKVAALEKALREKAVEAQEREQALLDAQAELDVAKVASIQVLKDLAKEVDEAEAAKAEARAARAELEAVKADVLKREVALLDEKAALEAKKAELSKREAQVKVEASEESPAHSQPEAASALKEAATAFKAVTAKLTADGSSSTKENSDLKGKTFEGFAAAPKRTGSHLHDAYKLEKWKGGTLATLKKSYQEDEAKRVHKLFWSGAEEAAKKYAAVSGQKAELPHERLDRIRRKALESEDVPDEAQSVVSHKSGIFGALEEDQVAAVHARELAKYGPNVQHASTREGKRNAIIDGHLSSAYKEALSDTEQKLLEDTFGEDATSAQALYVRLVCHWQGTNDQRKRAKKEFEGVQVLQGETAYQFLDRVKFYVEKAGKWGTVRPDVGEFAEKVLKAVDKRVEVLPNDVKLSHQLGLMQARVGSWSDANETYSDLLVLVQSTQETFTNHPDELDEPKSKTSHLSEKGKGKGAKGKGGAGNAGRPQPSAGGGGQQESGTKDKPVEGGDQSKPAPGSKPKTRYCLNFVQGKPCRFGEKCRFLHEEPAEGVCLRWAREGVCTKKDCKFSHQVPQSSQVPAPAEQEEGPSQQEREKKPVDETVRKAVDATISAMRAQVSASVAPHSSEEEVKEKEKEKEAPDAVPDAVSAYIAEMLKHA